MASESIILHFGKRPHELDARTLIGSLGSMENALRAIATDTPPSASLRIKVRTFQSGSFEIPVEIVEIMGAGALALTSPDWPGAKESIKVLVDLIKVSLAARGKEPIEKSRSGNTVTIKGSNNVNVTVDQKTLNIYLSGSEAVEALKSTFQAIESDREVKSFTILDKKRKPLIKVTRRSFPYVSRQKIERKAEQQKTSERVTLTVFKVVFDDGYKWEFYYRGIKISAQLLDGKFLKQVRAGMRFGRGDALEVDLEIVKVFDDTVQLFGNKAYYIRTVHRVLPRNSQPELGVE